MARKTFGDIKTDNVYSSLSKATSTAKTKGAEKKAQGSNFDEIQTQGKAGCKLPRINMAFSPANHKYLKLVARASGKSMTEVCNEIIEEYMRLHPTLIEKANAVLDEMGTDGIMTGKDKE